MEEFNTFIEGFDMPFFYLPGNHDLGNEVADKIWDDLYGVVTIPSRIKMFCFYA